MPRTMTRILVMNQLSMHQMKTRPVVGSMAAGLIASLCCGGALIFASIGLGAFWSVFGFSRYIPQALAAGAFSIVAINYFSSRRAAESVCSAGDGESIALRRGMFLSAALGLATMAASFVFLEWLNHAMVNPHFLSRPEYSQALIPGVPNVRLLYALASFWALALLWALPWPGFSPLGQQRPVALQRGLRVGMFAATAGVIVVLVVNAMSGGSGHGGRPNTGTAQHGSAAPRSH